METNRGGVQMSGHPFAGPQLGNVIIGNTVQTYNEELGAGTAANDRAYGQLPSGAPKIRLYSSKNKREDIWKNLPLATKAFIVVCFLESLGLLAYAVFQLVRRFAGCGTNHNQDGCDDLYPDGGCPTAELTHISALNVVWAAFFLWFVVDSIIKENFMELGVAVFISVLATGRLLYWIFRGTSSEIKSSGCFKTLGDGGQAAATVFVLAALGLTLGLAQQTWAQFGWRMYSKFAADMRVNSSRQKHQLYLLVNRFTTMIKVDFMLTLGLFLVSLAISVENLVRYNEMSFGKLVDAAEKADPDGTDHPDAAERLRSFRHDTYYFLTLSCLSWLLNVTWTLSAYQCTKRELKTVVTGLLAIVVVPLGIVVAQIVFYFLIQDQMKEGRGKDKQELYDRDSVESYLISFIFFFAARIWVCWDMNLVLSRFNKLGGATNDLNLQDNFQDNTMVHPALVPLMKGDWLYKPSQGAPRKRRFFQLSTDYTQLRWAWDKSIYMFHVQDIITHEEALQVELRMLDRTLFLGFQGLGQYRTWVKGFEYARDGLNSYLGGLSTDEAHKREVSNYSTHQNQGMVKRVWDAALGRPVLTEEQLRQYYRQITLQVLQYLDRMAGQQEGVPPGSDSGGPVNDTDPLAPDSSTAHIMPPSQENLNGGQIRTLQDAAVFLKTLQAAEIASTKSMVIQPMLDQLKMKSRDSGAMPDAPPIQALESRAASPSTSLTAQAPGHGPNEGPLTLSVWQPDDTPQEPALPQMAIQPIPYSQLTMGKYLGRGGESAVHAALYNQTVVAVKPISRSHEINIYAHAGSHDNIVQLRGVSTLGQQQLLVMEYCPRGNLDVYLHHQSSDRRDQGVVSVLQIARQIARGMLHLHTRTPPVQHRDLKPGNVFISHGFSFKIGDFGQSRLVQVVPPNGGRGRGRNQGSALGTAAYAAPELYIDNLAPEPVDDKSVQTILKSDVYSFGVTLHEMLTRRRPFPDKIAEQIGYAWWNAPEEMALPRISPPPNMEHAGVMQHLISLQEQCTQYEPRLRPDFNKILDEIKDMMERTRLRRPQDGSNLDVV